MQADSEGFLYPVVDEAVCVDCGLCEKVCHEQHPFDERLPLNVYAAINKDESVRIASSSGGIFYLLAEKTIAEGGIVFGARFDDQWQVVIDYADTLDGVRPFMGSKYVQARIASAYKDAEAFLKSGRKVLFSGSPCQIAGLHHFLAMSYDNLTTVDFVCHGVPSPKVWQLYLDEVVTASRRVIKDIKFRNKRNGWKKFNFVLSYNEKDEAVSLSSYHGTNHFMRAFLSDMILRPSCHECRAKQGRSHSDITIADFWGINNSMPEMDDDKGTGLILLNTEKGRHSLDWNKVSFKESAYNVAARYNGGLRSITKPHPKRSDFFAHLDSQTNLVSWIDICLRPTLKQRIMRLLRKLKSRVLFALNNLKSGGVKTENPTIKPSENIPLTLSEARISNVTFRKKDNGWKTYEMEIKLK